MKKPVVDYRKLRLSNIRTPEYSHLLLLLGEIATPVVSVFHVGEIEQLLIGRRGQAHHNALSNRLEQIGHRVRCKGCSQQQKGYVQHGIHKQGGLEHPTRFQDRLI